MTTTYFKAFVGLAKSQLRRKIVISPIVYPSQAEKIVGLKGKQVRSTLGYLAEDFRSLTYIKSPMTQGAVNDLVVMLKGSPCREIVFLGAIGGLEKGLKLGDLVVSSRAKDIKSVASLHEETKANLLRWRKQGHLGIDLESQVFFKAAKKAGLQASAVYLVTDLPLSRPFYKKKTKGEEIRIKQAIEQAVLRAFVS